MNSTGASLRVTGLVQGVGYRYFCLSKARSLHLTGWVKNDYDGAVSLTVEGDRSAIESLIEELKIGPINSNVTDISVDWCEFAGSYSNFEVTF